MNGRHQRCRASVTGNVALHWHHFTGRQRFKYRHLATWWYPGFYFLFTYVAKRGFLDGRARLHYAAYKAWYFRTIWLLIREQSANKI
jgi:hypothetical protein